jgi:hypothetical protein
VREGQFFLLLLPASLKLNTPQLYPPAAIQKKKNKLLFFFIKLKSNINPELLQQ